MSTDIDYRYPGSRPFYDTDFDRRLYFGRDHEKQSLLHMVLAERLVVLFAKSGIGKTSLINAGIIQQLRKRDFIPLKVRLNDPDSDPVQTLYDQIKQTVGDTNTECNPGPEHSLWQFFKTTEFWSPEDKLLTPVLILDQFEELFTLHSQQHKNRFITELADLIRVGGHQKRDASSKYEKDFHYSESLPDVKIIISMREDFLAQLEEMAHQIPAILQNRFRMLPLKRHQAKLAIEEPARLKDEHIHIAQFQYAPETVKAMLDFLCRRTTSRESDVPDVIEPFQLQLLCQHIEEKVRNREAPEGTHILIKPEDLGGDEGMKQVLKDFYNKQIHWIKPGWKRKNVRELCQKGLISETNRRLSLEEEEIERKYKLTKSILADLVDRRLLRSEPRVGSVYYELSHDTLVTSIREAQYERKRRNTRLAGFLVVSLMVMVFGLLYLTGKDFYHQIYSDWKYSQAKKQKNNGEFNNAEEIYQELLEFNPKHLEAYEDLGRIYIENGRLIKANALFEAALDNGVRSVTIYHLAGKVCEKVCGKTKLVEKTKKYYQRAIEELAPLASGESHINTRIYTDFARFLAKRREVHEAVKYYNLAIKYGDDNYYTFKELAKLYSSQENVNAAIENYERARANGDKSDGTITELAILHIKNGDYDETVELYKDAVNVNPENIFTFKKLVDELNREEANDRSDQIYQIAFDAYLNAQSFDSRNAGAYSKLARYYIKKKDIDQAITGFSHIVKRDPEYAYIYYDLIRVISSDDKNDHGAKIYQIAFDAYLKAKRVTRHSADFYRRLAIDYIEKNEIEPAIIGYEHIVNLDSENAYIYSGLAKALKHNGATAEMNQVYQTAIDAYQDLLYKGDRKSTTFSGLANLYIAKDEFSQVIEIFEQGVAANPRNAQIYDELVTLLKKKGAESEIKKIYSIATRAYERLKNNGDLKSGTYRRLINLYLAQDKYKQAVDAYEKGIRRNPRIAYLYRDFVRKLKKSDAKVHADKIYALATKAADQKYSYYSRLGDKLFEQKKFEFARENYQNAIQTSPKDQSAYLRLGATQLQLRKYDSAIQSFRKTLALDDKSEMAYGALGTVLAKKGRYWEGIEILKEGLKQKYNNKLFKAQTYNNMGFVLNKLGVDYQAAVNHLEKAAKLNQDQVNIFVYSNLGYSYMELDDLATAQTKLDQALKYTRSKTAKISIFSPAPYKNLGRLQYKKGNDTEAVEILEKAKQNGPYYVDTYYNLGLAYLNNGDGSKVDQLYREAVTQDPENIDFKRHYIEVFLRAKDFKMAHSIANEILKEDGLSAEMLLWARVTSFAALLFQKKRSQAQAELETFFSDYKALSANDNPFQIAVKWKNLVGENGGGLAEQEKHLILTLIDILESQNDEAKEKFIKLDAVRPDFKR